MNGRKFRRRWEVRVAAALAVVLARDVGAQGREPDNAPAAATAAVSRMEMGGFPVILYSPETSLGAGGGLTVTFRRAGADEARLPDQLSLFGLYTAKSQFMAFIAPETFSADGAWKLRLGAGYRDFPEEFYGIGNDVPNDPEDFTAEDIMIQPWLLRRVWSHLRAGLFCDWKHTDVSDIEEGRRLASGAFRGSEGGVFAGAGPALEWDSRDRLFWPTRGARFEMYAGFYRDAFGGDYEAQTYGADFRRYFSAGSNRVFAIQAAARSTEGDVPFTELARLEELRGINGNRYRDRKAAWGQIEYRFPLGGRFSGVAFGGAGEVVESWSDLDLGDLKPAGGAGVRFALNRRERIQLRLDIGVSEDGVFPYLRMLEAF